MASAMHLHKMLVRNSKLLKAAWKSLQHNVSQRLTNSKLIPIRIPVAAQRHPLHPVAALKQRQSGWLREGGSRHFSTASKGLSKSASGVGSKPFWPLSATRTSVEKLTGRSPFASTLRPNLTGGAFPRSAGGYSMGSGRMGGARYFSHTPAAPAQVVQNVSQAVRAFLLSGQRAQYAGTDPRTGVKQYRAMQAKHAEVASKVSGLPMATPGSYVDFRINPTITALTSLDCIPGFPTEIEGSAIDNDFSINNLNTAGLLDAFSVDFSRALKDLAAIMSDLRTLAALGDLPITYRMDSGQSMLRVHFPGCDSDTVENLCREIGVKRGLVSQDDNFDAYAGTEIALLFPFAPSETQSSEADVEDEKHIYEQYYAYMNENPSSRAASNLWPGGISPRTAGQSGSSSWSQQTGFELVQEQHDAPDGSVDRSRSPSLNSPTSSTSQASSRPNTNESPLEYQDFEGIYRFIELCDHSRR